MPSTPTETDLRLSEQIGKLAEQLTDFRVDTERRFGTVEREIGELKADMRTIKQIGGWLLATIVVLGTGIMGSIIWWSNRITYDYAQMSQRVEQHQHQLDKLDASKK